MPQTQENQSLGSKIVDTVVGDPCTVPVYHTDFPFPPEGGKIVKIGNSMYFVKTYIVGCENAGLSGTIIKSSEQSNTPSGGVVAGGTRSTGFQAPPTGSGTVVEFFIGNECLVPIYHTDFPFPKEGGKIIKKGNQLFFVKTYLPGCENAV